MAAAAVRRLTSVTTGRERLAAGRDEAPSAAEDRGRFVEGFFFESLILRLIRFIVRRHCRLEPVREVLTRLHALFADPDTPLTNPREAGRDGAQQSGEADSTCAASTGEPDVTVDHSIAAETVSAGRSDHRGPRPNRPRHPGPGTHDR